MIHPITIESAGGEYMESVVVVEWTRKTGEKVKAGETVVVVETAKAATEIPASHDGYLTEIFFEAGAEAPVGALLGNIGDTATDTAASAPEGQAQAEPRGDTAAAPTSEPARQSATAPQKQGRVIATPLARRIARQRNIDLSTVKGTGPKGRIKRRDVDTASMQGTTVGAAAPETALTAQPYPSVPVVLLHGFGADRSTWHQVAPLLDTAHRLVMPELPGHGGAAAVPVSGIDDLAFAIADTLEAQGIEEAHIVGHSLGGATALALSRIGSVRIRSFCLIAPGGLGEEINIPFLNGLVRATSPDELAPWLDRMVANPACLPASMAQAVLRQRARNGSAHAMQAELIDILFPYGVQGMRLTSALQAINVPAKIIWGLKDAVIPSSQALTAPGSIALHLLHDVGHAPQIEQPVLVARLINELVRSAECFHQLSSLHT